MLFDDNLSLISEDTAKEKLCSVNRNDLPASKNIHFFDPFSQCNSYDANLVKCCFDILSEEDIRGLRALGSHGVQCCRNEVLHN